MLIGAHESIAGGIELAPKRALEDGCEVLQIFSGSPTRWEPAPLVKESISAFRKNVKGTGLKSVIVHGSYLINPASPDKEAWKRSRRALLTEYRRCKKLGADYLVIHPGSHKGSGAGEGIARVADLLDAVLDMVKDGPIILLENTAGSGNVLGGSFSELSRIRDNIHKQERVAYCFDTAHAFAAGYDISDEKSLDSTLERFDSEAGVDLIKTFHLNDTERALGSKVDRHARIGEGILGLVPFARLMTDGRFKTRPGILETPPQSEGESRYGPQIRTLINLRGFGDR